MSSRLTQAVAVLEDELDQGGRGRRRLAVGHEIIRICASQEKGEPLSTAKQRSDNRLTESCRQELVAQELDDRLMDRLGSVGERTGNRQRQCVDQLVPKAVDDQAEGLYQCSPDALKK